MNKYILIFFTLLCPILSFSQNTNYGFEKWTTQFSHEDPKFWSTGNRERNRDITLAERSSDALDGSYSILIESKMYEDDSVLGYVVLGDVGDNGPEGGVPVSAAADSLIFWVKYKVIPGDTAIAFIATRNNGSITGMNQIGWVGESNMWERKSIKVSPAAMDSIVIGIAASDGLKDIAFPGSWMKIDKIVVKDIFGQNITIPNYSFEDWDSFNYTNPDSWYTENRKLGPAANVTQSQKSYEGNYSVRMETTLHDGDTLRGYLSNAAFSYGEFGKRSLIYLPGTTFDSAELYYQYAPVLPDTADVRIELHSNGNRIAEANARLSDSTASFTRLTIPFYYNTQTGPDSIRIIFSSGRNIGSVFHVDAFSLKSKNTSVPVINESPFILYPNPTSGNIYVEHKKLKPGYEYELFDINGILIQKGTLNQQKQIATEVLHSGVYILSIATQNGSFVQKFLKE